MVIAAQQENTLAKNIQVVGVFLGWWPPTAYIYMFGVAQRKPPNKVIKPGVSCIVHFSL